MRKALIIFAAALAMGATQIPMDAQARPHGAHSGGSHFSGGGGVRSSGFRSGISSGSAVRFSSGRAWSGGRHYRHYRHNRVVLGAPFIYTGYNSCYRLRHVLTPWGWTWRRVYVCGYYDY